MEEKKSNSGLIVLIVILIIFILGLGGFIGYTVLNGNLTFNNKTDSQNNTNNETNNNQNINDNNNQNINDNNNQNVNENESTNKINEEDLLKYLNYVPISEVYSTDAYSGSTINYDNIDKKIILENVYKNVPLSYKETMSKEVENPLSPSGKTNAGILISNFDNQTKEMYNNIINNINEFEINGGIIIKQNGYYTGKSEQAVVGFEKINKIKDYSVTDNELIIYEQAGFYEDSDLGIDIYYTSKKDNIIYSINQENANFNGGYMSSDNKYYETEEQIIEASKNYILNNIDKFKTFKHTFRLNKDTNRYYWYQTELSE